MKTSLALLNKKGENAVPMVLAAFENLNEEGTSCFGLATPTKIMTDQELTKLSAYKLESPTAMSYVVSGKLPHSDLQIKKLADSVVFFEGTMYEDNQKHLTLELIFEKTDGSSYDVAEAFVKNVEGDFSIIMNGPEGIVATRDPIGVKPMYYGENDAISAIASTKKMLWKLGIMEPKSFPPGHVAVVTQKGFKFTSAKTLPYQKPSPLTMEKAAETIEKLLRSSIRKRVFGLEEVAVAFSGGLDSSIVAFLADKCGVKVQLVHVSLESQPETEEALKAAKELRLPIKIHLFKEEDVEKIVANVVDLVEEPDPIKASVGVPFYWTAEKTVEAGFKVLLAGQGADELFGGYQRYVNENIAHGNEKVRQTMYNDVVNIYESNIERDEKICGFHNLELRLPFASFEIAKFAMSLPTELKLGMKRDSLRKLVLRRAAANMGLSKQITQKPKKAVQYSTGINNALKRIARKKNLTMTEYVNRFFLEGKRKQYLNRSEKEEQ